MNVYDAHFYPELGQIRLVTSEGESILITGRVTTGETNAPMSTVAMVVSFMAMQARRIDDLERELFDLKMRGK